MTLTGECLCGGIKYRIAGRVFAARSCHCSRCRKAFGGAASAFASVDPAHFQWVEGEALLTVYESKQGAGKQFCRVCGSMLTGTYKGEVMGVALGCLNEDPGVDIEAHIFVGSKANWDVVPEEVPQYETYPEEE